MGLIKKIFGEKPARETGTPSSQFTESEDTTGQPGSKNATRRELVQVVLLETMRRHGIPSDWMECRVLSIVSKSAMPGLHVTLVVKQGHPRLLTYVPAFQGSYLLAVEKFDPKASNWLLSLSWQFEGMSAQAQMPEPGAWSGAGAAAAATGAAVAADAAAPPSVDLLDQDDELEEDLKALYAIRDAALSQDPRRPPDDHGDFEHTQPSE